MNTGNEVSTVGESSCELLKADVHKLQNADAVTSVESFLSPYVVYQLWTVHFSGYSSDATTTFATASLCQDVGRYVRSKKKCTIKSQAVKKLAK